MSRPSGGRGRGWLQAHKPAVPQPDPAPQTTPQQQQQPPPPAGAAEPPANFADSPSDYSEVLAVVRHINTNDDGILFNQKVKFIIETWTGGCQGGEDVERCLDHLYKCALQDADLTTKLVLLIASRTFLTQEIHGHNIRMMFLRKLQENFEGRVKLRSNRRCFRNGVQMLGEFYSKARMADGQTFDFMLNPLVSYMEMLLDGDEDDCKFLCQQLHLNGAAVRRELPAKFAEVAVQLRQLIVGDRLPKRCKLWLLLALEGANAGFGALPRDAQAFYLEALGTEAILDNNDDAASGIVCLKPPPPPQVSEDVSSVSSVTTSLDSVHLDTSSDSAYSAQQPRGGRPILGAGARFIKKPEQEDGGAGKEQQSGGKWGDKKKMPEGGNKKQFGATPPRLAKGWEHDDRFETDYN